MLRVLLDAFRERAAAVDVHVLRAVDDALEQMLAPLREHGVVRRDNDRGQICAGVAAGPGDGLA